MKKKIFVTLLIGIMIGLTTGIMATYKYQASEVGYTPSNPDFKVDNVENAISELYTKINSGSTSTGLIGVIENSNNYLANGYMKSIADDNNVIFGGYCWKIIRKTDDEDIRMLYNGLPQDGECTKTGEDTQIGTSKYSDDSTITNYSDSIVKTMVDNWYNTNLTTSYSDKINNIDLITREEASTVGGGYLVSGQQYWTQSPSGENVSTTSSCSISYSGGCGTGCSCSSSPSGEIFSNGIYIIVDSGELENSNNGAFGGEITGTCQYCRNYNTTDRKCLFSANYTGSCSTTANGSSLGVRPVITLKNTVTLTGGEGTTSNPYYIK